MPIFGELLTDFYYQAVPAKEAYDRINNNPMLGTISLATIYRCYNLLSDGESILVDKVRPGRTPVKIDAELEDLVETNHNMTSKEMAEALGCSKTKVLRRLKVLGYKSKWNIWVPYDLSPHHEKQRKDIANYLLAHERSTLFLRRLVTMDEKWIFANNCGKIRSWVRPNQYVERAKRNRFGMKFLLCVFWWPRGILYWELLPAGKTVTSDVYCEQLEKVSAEYRSRTRRTTKRGGPTFLHDNARPHVSKQTKECLERLNFDVLPHPPYSPDIAPSDFYLFRSMQHYLNQKKFKNEEQVKSALQDFFNSKPEEFYESGIASLKNRWINVVENEGKYIVD